MEGNLLKFLIQAADVMGGAGLRGATGCAMNYSWSDHEAEHGPEARDGESVRGTGGQAWQR